jgi:hypothetical protein
MKYLEELSGGHLFIYEDKKYVLTSDYRIRNKKDQKQCISMDNGFNRWLDASTIVDFLDLYYRDIDGNILPLKTFEK